MRRLAQVVFELDDDDCSMKKIYNIEHNHPLQHKDMVHLMNSCRDVDDDKLEYTIELHESGFQVSDALKVFHKRK